MTTDDQLKLKKLYLIKKATQVIAIDGGEKICRRLNITPHLVMGDGDSAKLKNSTPAVFIKKTEQNQSDFAFVLDWLESSYPRQLISLHIFGLCGKRFDHELSNVFELTGSAKRRKKLKLVTCRVYQSQRSDFIVHDFSNQKRLSLYLDSKSKTLTRNQKQQPILTCFALSKCHNLQSRGLKYNLKALKQTYSSQGLSNVLLQSPVNLTAERGRVLITLDHAFKIK